MKTAEEFVRETHWFSNEGSAIKAVSDRDLEMWKKGMTDAAALSADSLNGAMYVFVPNIISKRDHTKSV